MLDFGKALYAHREKKIEVSSPQVKVNQMGPAGMGISTHRKGGVTGAKISYAATIFDILCKYTGSFSLYRDDSQSKIFCEYKGRLYFCDGPGVYFATTTGADEPASSLVFPYLFWEMIYGTTGSGELKEAFKECLGEFTSSGYISSNNLYKFCDSFYYGSCLSVSISEFEITPSEAEAAIRSGNFVAENFSTKFFGTSSYMGISTPKKKTSKKKKSDFLQECKDGLYRIAYEWPEEIKGHIISPSFLDKYEATPEFEEIVKKIKFRADRILERMDMGLTGAEAIGEDCMNIMLVGKPGTGKTTLVYAIGAATGIPVCSTVHTKHTDEDEYEGKTKIVDGKPCFVETDSLLFHQFGGIDVCEEINLPDPSVTMGGLGQKLVYPYIVKKNGYETIVRHPLNIIFGTMNVGTNGSNGLNQALANRFKTPYILDDPTRQTFIDILKKASKKSDEVCEWVYNAYEKTVAYLRSPSVNEEEICQNLSIRTCLGAIDNLEEGQEPTRALINSIVGAIAIVDLDVARRVQTECIEALPSFIGEI